MIWIKTRAYRKEKNLLLCLFLKINLNHLWCVCTEDSQQAPACCSADITSFQMCFMHMVQCPTVIHCYQIFLFFHEIVMDLANIVFLCWPMEYTILKEVILLEVVYLCSVFCITGAPQKQILKFLLCKVYLHSQTCSRWYSPPRHSHLLTSNRRNQINPKVGTFIENTEIIWFEKIIGFHWKVQ